MHGRGHFRRQFHLERELLLLSRLEKHAHARAHGSFHLIGHAQAHRHALAQPVALGEHRHALVVGKAVIQHGARLVKALLACFRPQHDGDKAKTVLLCRGAQAVARGVCAAGFQPVAALVKPYQAVGVGQIGHASAGMGERVHPHRSMLEIVRMAAHLHREGGHVACGGVLRVIRQAGGVGVVGVVHAQLRRAGVHELGKGCLRARNMLGQGAGRVVGAGHDGGMQQILQRIHRARVQKRLTPDLCGGLLTHGYGVVQMEVARLQLLKADEQRHQLGHTGGLAALIGVFFKDDGSCTGLYQHRAGRCQRDRRLCLQRRGQGRPDEPAQRKQQRAQPHDLPSHTKNSFHA